MSENKQIVIRRIESQTEHRRAVLYGDDDRYGVIADLPSPDLKIGDKIEYEPYGVNFGFYVRRLSR